MRRAERERAFRIDQLRDSWSEALRTNARLREAVLQGASDDDFATLLRAKHNATERWSTLHAGVPEAESEAAYAAVSSADETGGVPSDAAETRACGQTAVRLWVAAQLLQGRVASCEALIDQYIKLALAPDSSFERGLDEKSYLEDRLLETTLVASDELTRFRFGLSNCSADAWRDAVAGSYASGGCSVTVSSSPEGAFDPSLEDLPYALLSLHGQMLREAAFTFERRVRHVGPQVLLGGISLDDAIRVKEEMERAGFGVKIVESHMSATGDLARRPIPEAVRREVWRRDEGRCVDCGSRERLEFDHIVPVSKGGSNTARNIELRCESCNRRKSDRI